jgi:hypothetical protein
MLLAAVFIQHTIGFFDAQFAGLADIFASCCLIAHKQIDNPPVEIGFGESVIVEYAQRIIEYGP